MELTAILDQAKKQLADTTGLKPVAITRAFEDEEGWHIGVAMLEMSRIPPSTDVLGDYEVLLNDCGGMVRFERRRARLRGETGEEERA